VAVAACSSEPTPGATPSPDSGAEVGHGAKDAASGADSAVVGDAAPLPDGPPAAAPDAGSGQGTPDGTSGAMDTRAGEADTGQGGDASPLPALVKMMVMGSSNEISTCWRAFLWQKLRAAGVTNFDFVGGQTDGPDCGVPGYDRNNESRNGTIVSQITAAQYASRFKANPPDIVLVHFGGADILRGIAPATVMPGYTLMVMQGRAVNPRIRFLVAEHTPMTPASCAKCPTTVPELNAAIVQWAKEISTAESPVSSVDLFTGLDAATDTSDRVHLNNAGSQKVADKWAAALLPIFKP
jgi:lysophospholipase L1-like esterase